MKSTSQLLVALLAAVHVRFSTPNVIGIDFGSENMKVGIVSPGSPLEIVNNFQSKRKTPTCISFYKGERLFGSDSFALMPRKPEITFSKLFRMLGKMPEHPHMEELERHYFPFDIYSNETRGVTTLKVDETYYTPEELLAMMMQHARDMTKNYGGKTIRDCVLTVPASFTQHERMALYTAASISDFNVLSLIEENTAAALNYGMDRNFDAPTTVLFYNMGSSSVQVSIVTYSTLVVKEAGNKNKTVSQFEVVGKSWDSSLGGFNFDMVLAEMLADRFNEAWEKKVAKSKTPPNPAEVRDIRKISRAMTRLRLEALKVKEVLSANNEYPIKIEQLHAEVDLATKFTRTEFEAACASLFARVTTSIEEALRMADMTLQNITAVEIIGGGVRVPRIKKILEDYFRGGDLDLGQHLNGDEAMALGAAFRAANLSTAFRVRRVGMQDISSFGVAVQLSDNPQQPSPKSPGFFDTVANLFKETEPAAAAVSVEGEGDLEQPAVAWTKRATLFPRKSPIPSKVKTVTFSHDHDIVCRLEYEVDGVTENLLPAGTSHVIALYNVTGIAQFVQENAAKGVVGSPKVHLSFLLDGSGVVTLSKAEITLDLPAAESKAAEEEEVETNAIEPEAAPKDAAGEAIPEEPAASSSTDEPAKEEEVVVKKAPLPKAKKEKDRVLRKMLTVGYDYEALVPPQWTAEHTDHSRERLRLLDSIDRQRREREAALNTLEGYILMVKNKLQDNAEELSVVSTEEERAGIIALCDEIEEWLYGDGRDQAASAFTAKEREVKARADPVFRRFSELTERPSAVQKTRKQLAGITKRAATWPETMPQITSNETEKMLDAVAKVTLWLDDNEAEQAKRTPFEEPAFFSADIAPQMKPVATMLDRLLKKPKPAPEKLSSNSTNSTGNSSDPNATIPATGENETDSGGEPSSTILDEDVLSPEDAEAKAEEPPVTKEAEEEPKKKTTSDSKKKSKRSKK